MINVPLSLCALFHYTHDSDRRHLMLIAHSTHAGEVHKNSGYAIWLPSSKHLICVGIEGQCS